jgi:hypothetical protein
MAFYEENMFDDLADEAEGAAEAYDDRFDEMDEADEMEAADEMDEGDEMDALDEGDEMDEIDAVDEGDEMEAADAYDEYDEIDSAEEGDEADDDALEAAMAYALGAEDTDEFFRRIGGFLRRAARGAVNVARRAAPVIGQIARTAAPLLRVIPHPLAQGAATAANLLGQLRMEGASEEEALEAMAELAARNPRVRPVVAGLAARALVRRAGPALPAAVRRQVVRNVAAAARTLVRRQGPTAIRALPRVVRSVRRTAATRRTPPAVRPRVALNTARRVAASPRLAQRLSRPLPRGRAILRQAVGSGRLRTGIGPVRRVMGGPLGRGALGGGMPGRAYGRGYGGPYGRRGRRIVIRGPVTITIAR